MKRSHAASEGSNLSPSSFQKGQVDAPASPPLKKGRGATDEDVNSVDVAAIVSTLAQKPEWRRKVGDPAIAARWRAEAIEQGASSASIDAAIARLLRHATLSNEQSADSDPCYSALGLDCKL